MRFNLGVMVLAVASLVGVGSRAEAQYFGASIPVTSNGYVVEVPLLLAAPTVTHFPGGVGMSVYPSADVAISGMTSTTSSINSFVRFTDISLAPRLSFREGNVRTSIFYVPGGLQEVTNPLTFGAFQAMPTLRWNGTGPGTAAPSYSSPSVSYVSW